MYRFSYVINGKDFEAVEINGMCVSDDTTQLDSIILAESAMNDHISEHDSWSIKCDEEVFGYAPKDLIINGTIQELEEYAKGLL